MTMLRFISTITLLCSNNYLVNSSKPHTLPLHRHITLHQAETHEEAEFMKSQDPGMIPKLGPTELMTQFLYHVDPTFIPKMKQKLSKLVGDDNNSKRTDIQLTNYYGLQHYGGAYIGKPSQYFDFIFDTASSGVWIYSKNKCVDKAGKDNCPQGRTRYDSSKSSQFNDEYDEQITLTYARGKVSGDKVQDLFCFEADVPEKCIEIDMLLADYAQGMDQFRTSGFIGLAPESYNADGLETLPEQIDGEDNPEHQIDSIFGIYMTRNFLYAGAITFAGIDMKYAQAGKTETDIDWFKLAKDKKYWEIESQNMQFVVDNAQNQNARPMRVIFDTRKKYNIVPIDIFKNIVDFLQARGITFEMPADTPNALYTASISGDIYNKLPDIQLDYVGGKSLKIPKEVYLEHQFFGGYLLTFETLADMSAYGKDENIDYVVLGISFLSDFYSIYDLSNLRVGFIKADPDAGVLTFERFMFVFAAALTATAILSCGCFCCCCCLCKPCRQWRENNNIKNQAKVDATLFNMTLMSEDTPDRVFGQQQNKLPIDKYNKNKHAYGKKQENNVGENNYFPSSHNQLNQSVDIE